MMQLSDLTYEQYDAWKHDKDFWDQKIHGIIEKEGWETGTIRRFSYGATVVYSYKETYVIKLYPAYFKDQFVKEREVLESIHHNINVVETPKLVRYGMWEGWNYIIMTQLKGELLIDLWERFSPAEKLMLSQDLGKTIKEFHSIQTNNFTSIRVDWDAFIKQQLQNMKNHHQYAGLQEALLSDLDHYVEEQYMNYHPQEVLLTGEYTPFNLMINKVDGAWKLTGVIDFADCFLGDADYDLLGPILFMFNSNQKLIFEFLKSYGYTQDGLDEALQKKLMIYTILHRYSDINSYLPQDEEPNSFQALSQVLFPFHQRNHM
jgi:hygromycin-B 7''-O-kinase